MSTLEWSHCYTCQITPKPCPEFGCKLYENKDGVNWCSVCEFDSEYFFDVLEVNYD